MRINKRYEDNATAKIRTRCEMCGWELLLGAMCAGTAYGGLCEPRTLQLCCVERLFSMHTQRFSVNIICFCSYLMSLGEQMRSVLKEFGTTQTLLRRHIIALLSIASSPPKIGYGTLLSAGAGSRCRVTLSRSPCSTRMNLFHFRMCSIQH